MSNGSKNQISLIGRVGADPESHKFQSGDTRVAFNLATSESWTNDGGEKQERTQWHRVSILNQGLAKIAQDYVRKGDLVGVDGSMEYRDYEKDGVKHRAAEVVLRPYGGELYLLGKAKGPQ